MRIGASLARGLSTISTPATGIGRSRVVVVPSLPNTLEVIPMQKLIACIFVALAATGCAANVQPAPPTSPQTLEPVAKAQSSRVKQFADEDAYQLALYEELATEPVAADTARLEARCPAEGTRVLLIGDSLSVGLGRPMAQLAKACGTPFHHGGVTGSHVTQWNQDSWLLPQLAYSKATVVLVSLGGNDFIRNDPHNVARATESLVAKLRERDIELLWISPPTMPFDDRVGARQLWQHALGGEAGGTWYPSEQLELARVSDKIHLTPVENTSFAGKLWRWMSTHSVDESNAPQATAFATTGR
jgi:hypothetical protein